MGALGGILGTAGGASGTGYKTPQQATVQSGVDQNQLATSAGGVQNSLASQQALLNALQSQRGLAQQNAITNQQQILGNQLAANNGASNLGAVYNQQGALNQQLANANGIGTQNAAIAGLQGVAGQQALTAQQYQNIANGVGPNPAQAMLNQATGQNVANQAALMAGQRGAASNVGLIARQAAQQGAATQQEAVGQGATLQAQQQLNALSGLTAQQQAQAATQQAIGGLGTTQLGAQQAGVTNQAQLASQQIAAQQAQQAAQAQQANNVAAQQIGATTTNTQAQQSQQQILQNALAAQNSANVASQGSINAGNTALASKTIEGQQGLVGGLLNGIGGAIGTLLAEGGEIKNPSKYAEGTPAAPVAAPVPASTSSAGPQSSWGKFTQGFLGNLQEPDTTKQEPMFNMASPENAGAQNLQKGSSQFAKSLVGSLLSQGGMMKQDYTAGGNVKANSPQQKAVKAGNSYDNDKIPAYLSEGEVVIPRSVMQSGDPIKGSADFVAKVLGKRRG